MGEIRNGARNAPHCHGADPVKWLKPPWAAIPRIIEAKLSSAN